MSLTITDFGYNEYIYGSSFLVRNASCTTREAYHESNGMCGACEIYITYALIVDAVANTFKQLESAYFLIKENDTVIGGLPAFVLQSIPGIKMLRLMPWNLFGGIQLIAEAPVNLDLLFQAIEIHLDQFVNEQGLCETVFTLSPPQTAACGYELTEAGCQKR